MEIVEIWQNLKKKRNADYDFPPPLYVGGKKTIINLIGRELCSNFQNSVPQWQKLTFMP